MNNTQDTDYLNTVEASILLGCTPSTIIYYIKKGHIPAKVKKCKKNNRYFIPVKYVFALQGLWGGYCGDLEQRLQL